MRVEISPGKALATPLKASLGIVLATVQSKRIGNCETP